MPEFTIRPLSIKGEKILTEDIIVAASTAFSAKMQAEMIFPNCYEYQVVDMKELVSAKMSNEEYIEFVTMRAAFNGR